MIIDRYNLFSDAQAETTVGTHDSDNVVDLGAAGDAEYQRTRLHIQVPEACTSGGSATVQFKLLTAEDEDFADPTTLWQSDEFDYGDLEQGYKVTGPSGLPLPSGCLQFLKGQIIIGTAALTAGAFDVFLSKDGDSNKF
ncbi:MAG: Bbp16 family capsid cement protein [Pseudodesulfovibrio sp.]|uniref:Bbp16 family capsid cement protein n=1 Tax=Pseudodesulfovibrio sp. TaxID=2035812 RepID=UPI003D0FEC61